MTYLELVDFLKKQIEQNPNIAECPVNDQLGAEINGIGFGGTGGTRLMSDYYPKTEEESSWAWFESIFKLAGFTVIDHYELTNNYWPRSHVRLVAENPWWLVKTSFGLIRIGWRKRVISINWDFCDCIVTDDGVTKENRLVHAYSAEKAIEYLRALKAAASLPSSSSTGEKP